MTPSTDELDKGTWAWLTLIGCVFSGFFTGAVTYSPGIFHVALADRYEVDATIISLVGALCSSLLYLIGPIAGILVKRYTCRVTHCIGGLLVFVGLSCSFFTNGLVPLFFTYSLLVGIGTGFCSTSYSVVPIYRFKKRLGLMVGIQMLGGGFSLIVGGPLVQFFLDTFGLHGAYLVLGAYGSHLIICGLLMKPSKFEIQSNRNIKERTTDFKPKKRNCSLHLINCLRRTWNEGFIFKVIKDIGLLLMYVSSFLWHIPTAAFQVHIPNHSVTEGATPQQASFLFIIIGIFSIIGRLLTGICLGLLSIGPLKLEMICLGVIGIGTVLLPVYSSMYTGQCVYSGLYGIIVGVLTTLFSPICFRFAQVEDVPTAVGLRYFVGGISYIIGPTIIGMIIDMGGSYKHGFYLCGGFYLSAAVIDFISIVFQRSSHYHQDHEQEKEIPVTKETRLQDDNCPNDVNSTPLQSLLDSENG